jgi:tight adherence protein B
MSLIIAIQVFLILIGLSIFLLGKNEKISPIDRINPTQNEMEQEIQKTEYKGWIKGAASFLPKSKKESNLDKYILQSDTKYNKEEITIVKILLSTALSFLIFSITKSFFLTLPLFILIWFSPNLYLKNKVKKKTDEFNSQIADGLLIVTNALKAGYSFLQAVALVSKEMQGPFAKEFSRLLKEMSFGLSIDESFRNMLKRVESEDLQLVINAILIQKDVGGNLSEVIDKIIETIRERQRIKNEVKTLTAQGRLSGTLIAVLPFVLAIFLYLINREYLLTLISNPLGVIMIVYGGISQLIGFVFIRKITNVEL